MPVYYCRWPNGDLTIVGASNKEDAIFALDEFGDAGDDGVDLFKANDFMADFTLTDQGELVLKQFGERALSQIMDRAYPVLDKAMMDDEDPENHKYPEAAAEERRRLSRVNKPQLVEAEDSEN